MAATSAASSMEYDGGGGRGAGTEKRVTMAEAAGSAVGVDGAAGGAGAVDTERHTLKPPAAAATSLSALLKSKTVNSAKTMVMGGELVSVPFPTSTKPFVRKHPTSAAYGSVDPVLNGAGKATTTARHDYTVASTTTQSAGSSKKLPTKYCPTAHRNRVKTEFKRLPPPFKSTLSFDMGVVNKSLHPFRTINSITQSASAVPMHERVGFTNAYVTSEITKRLHKPLFTS